jgi:hypothetical protein
MIYEKLITVKIINCVLNGRKNQNISFWFSPMSFGFNKGDEITEEWVLYNLSSLKKHISTQNNTKVTLQ